MSHRCDIAYPSLSLIRNKFFATESQIMPFLLPDYEYAFFGAGRVLVCCGSVLGYNTAGVQSR